MKRFITYLFEYEKGKKGKNIGFIRVDIRNAVCRMEIHLHNLYRYQGKGQIFLFVNPENLTGLLLGNIVVSQGRGEAGYAFSTDGIAGSDYHFAEVIGVGIRFGDRYYAASSWVDAGGEQIGEGRFVIWEPEVRRESIPSTEEETIMQKESPQKPSANEFSDAETQFVAPQDKFANETGIKPQTTSEAAAEPDQQTQHELSETNNSTSEENRYITQQETSKSPAAVRTERIDINGIRQLPKRNHYLCNNSFVIHGYLNYHHLMRKEIMENGVSKSYLGVPGVYERPERMMAMLFGFPEFEAEKEFYGAVQERPSDEEAVEERNFFANSTSASVDSEPTVEGEFGYWLCLLDM
jgi:hypothetical protein